jgi:hypothetical protein
VSVSHRRIFLAQEATNAPVHFHTDKKSCLSTYHVGAKGETRYSSYSFFIPALYGVCAQRHDHAAFYALGQDPQCY